MKRFLLFLWFSQSIVLAAHAKNDFNKLGSVQFSTPTITYGYRHTHDSWARDNPKNSEPQVEPVASALSDLDDTVCGVSPCDFEDISSNVIPPGDDFDAAIEGAKTFEQNGLNAHDYFYEWVGKVCGADSWDLNLNLVFDKLVDAPNSRASSRGCFQEDEELCKPDPDNAPPTTTSWSGSCKGKRAGGSPCQKHVHQSIITSSVAKPTTVTTTCEMKSYSQACFNYYSVFVNYPWVNKYLTCTDSFTGRAALPATGRWERQHTNRVWREYTTTTYTRPKTSSTTPKKSSKSAKPDVVPGPDCHIDEFPPGYFVPRGTNQDLAGQSGQLVRWLPGVENSNAGARLWRGFCLNHDGGKGNGQYTKKRDASREQVINEDLNDLQQPGQVITKSKTNSKTTTYSFITQYAATYSNAVFTMDFDWTDHNDQIWDEPSEDNNWYLDLNPCWPKYIEPENLGFVLLNEDDWYYTTSGTTLNSAQRESRLKELDKYKTNPDTSLISEANTRRSQGLPSKRDAGNFPIRDDFNITGGFPDDVQTEVINCRDAYCTEELEKLGNDENYIYIPGKEPTVVTPSVNADTISTQGASTIAPATQPETRGRVVPEIPVPTGPA